MRYLAPVVLLLALVLPSALAEESLDPVVADVVRMLGEGVDAGIIEAWLDSSGATPGTLSPDDLVALSKAEAPESLVKKLLAMSEAPAPPPAALPEPVPVEKEVATGESRVEFTVDYRPNTVEQEDMWDAWGLYLYLDGWPLAWNGGGTSVFSYSTKVLRFYERLEPGKHVIRILQEKHELKSKKKDHWSHQARVYPRTIVLEVDQEGEYRFDLKVNENPAFWKKDTGPVSYTILRNDALVTDRTGAGPATDEWPALCEEVKTGIPEDKMDSKSARRDLEGCVSWESLWTGVDELPDRDAVRENLAAYEYRPVPTSVQKRK